MVKTRREEMMKHLFALTIIALILSACSSKNLFTEASFEKTTYSIDHFKFQKEKIIIGTVYHFVISNSDRSAIKKVHLYVADTNKIEAFKIYPGSDSTYLVVAEIDWEVFSIKKIYQIEIEKDLSRKHTIEMHLLDKPTNTYLMNNTKNIPTGHFPAFNHGFDFSDLNFVFRHLINPQSNIDLGVLAPTTEKFAYTGKMHLAYVGNVTYKSHECHKYLLSGRGIGEKSGYLLVNKDFGYFEYMKLDVNYHSLMDIFRYELLSVTTISQREWETFVFEESKNYFSVIQ